MGDWSKDNFNVAIPSSIARLDYNQMRDQLIKNFTAIENVLGLLVLQTEELLKFLNLADTPASYSGQAGKFLRVKTDETGLEFGEAREGIGIIRESIFAASMPRSNIRGYGPEGEASLAASTMSFYPFLNPTQFNYKNIAVINSTQQAANIKLAVYSSIFDIEFIDIEGRSCYQPYQKIIESGVISLAEAGIKEYSFDIILEAGLYWLVIAVDADCTINGYDAKTQHLGSLIKMLTPPLSGIFCGWILDGVDINNPLPDEIDRSYIYTNAVAEGDYVPVFFMS